MFINQLITGGPHIADVYAFSENILLVGGLEHEFIFPYIGNFILPTDELICFRGVGLNHQPDPQLDQFLWKSRNWGMGRLIQRAIPQWSYPMYD